MATPALALPVAVESVQCPMPNLSDQAENAEASAIRSAQVAFNGRSDRNAVNPLNLAIGNVSLPMHPAFLRGISSAGDTMAYTPTAGTPEAREAILRMIQASGFSTEGLHSHVTAGGTGAMELMLRSCCQPGRPLLLIDPHYTNYSELAAKLGIPTSSVGRTLQEDGNFSLPNCGEIRDAIRNTGASAIVVIPYDNPSGQFIPQQLLNEIGSICANENIWMVSDEAYRGLVYTGDEPSSIWGIGEEDVPGIAGRRISIESASKVLNACGLRMGGLVTDNNQLHQKAVNLATPELCASAIGQLAMAALNDETLDSLKDWINQLRQYYKGIIDATADGFRKAMPELTVSSTQAAIYTVLDFGKIAPTMNTKDFVRYCATQGIVDDILVGGKPGTLFLAPMAGFYRDSKNAGTANPGRTQMRVAAIRPKEEMLLAPQLCTKLFAQYKLQSGGR